MLRSSLALSAFFFATGCTGNGGSQATPQETLQSMSSALSAGNRDQFLACKQLPQQGPPEEAKKMMGGMKQAYEKVLAEVGKSGQTAETLAAKLDSEMMIAMMGAGGHPGLPMPPGPK